MPGIQAESEGSGPETHRTNRVPGPPNGLVVLGAVSDICSRTGYQTAQAIDDGRLRSDSMIVFMI